MKKMKRKTLKITFLRDVFKKFPRLRVLFFLGENIDNKTKLKESQHLVTDLTAVIRQTFHKDTLKTHHLISPWLVARQEFGTAAKHYHTSLETLLIQVLQGKNIISKNVVANLVSFITLKHFVPIAVDDVEKIHGDITFALAKKESPKGLQKGDLYYADKKKILGAKLDFWKNKKTLPTGKTKNVLIHFEALPPITTERIQEIAEELVDLLEKFCGGKVKGAMASRKKNKISIL